MNYLKTCGEIYHYLYTELRGNGRLSFEIADSFYTFTWVVDINRPTLANRFCGQLRLTNIDIDRMEDEIEIRIRQHAQSWLRQLKGER